MRISSAYIKVWLNENFGNKGHFTSGGREFTMPSPFDRRYGDKDKFSINVETGLWQDFSAHESGNFIQLYAAIKKLEYRKAESDLIYASFLLEGENIFTEEERKDPKLSADKFLKPEDFWTPITFDMDPETETQQLAWLTVYERKLWDLQNPDKIQNTYYVAEQGRYSGRLIIPYWRDKKFFYMSSRALYPEMFPKYLNPPTVEAVKPSHVLYPFDMSRDYVVVCEGVLDAISLQIQGVNATTTGTCNCSYVQLDLLHTFGGDIYVGFDNDEAGVVGLYTMNIMRKKRRMKPIHILHPPEGFKDWNDAHMKDIDLVEHLASVHPYDWKREVTLDPLAKKILANRKEHKGGNKSLVNSRELHLS